MGRIDLFNHLWVEARLLKLLSDPHLGCNDTAKQQNKKEKGANRQYFNEVIFHFLPVLNISLSGVNSIRRVKIKKSQRAQAAPVDAAWLLPSMHGFEDPS